MNTCHPSQNLIMSLACNAPMSLPSPSSPLKLWNSSQQLSRASHASFSSNESTRSLRRALGPVRAWWIFRQA